MTDDSITVQVLKDIRTELREHGAQLREHGAQLREHGTQLRELTEGQTATNTRLETLDKRQLATEIRLATELTAVVGAIHELRDVLIEDRKLRADVTDHERRITVLETRLKA